MTHPYNPFSYPSQETLERWSTELPVTLLNMPMPIKIIDPPKFPMSVIEQQRLLKALLQPICSATLSKRRSYLSRSMDVALAESSAPPALG